MKYFQCLLETFLASTQPPTAMTTWFQSLVSKSKPHFMTTTRPQVQFACRHGRLFLLFHSVQSRWQRFCRLHREKKSRPLLQKLVPGDLQPSSTAPNISSPSICTVLQINLSCRLNPRQVGLKFKSGTGAKFRTLNLCVCVCVRTSTWDPLGWWLNKYVCSHVYVCIFCPKSSLQIATITR